ELRDLEIRRDQNFICRENPPGRGKAQNQTILSFLFKFREAGNLRMPENIKNMNCFRAILKNSVQILVTTF
ncbi:MAG: hypothetical protein ACM3Q2_17680, partial [Syntrophothermus sp.]